MSRDEEPRPGFPKVEWLEGQELSRWTFSTDDRETQEHEFSYWLGWHGFEETARPERTEGRIWYVRKQ